MTSLSDLIAAADRAVGGGGEKTEDFGPSLKEGIKRGLAQTVGGVGDLPARTFQLGKAFLGYRNAWDYHPNVDIGAANMFTDYLMNAWANPEKKLDKAGEMIGGGIGSSLYPSGLLKKPAEEGVKTALKTALKDTALTTSMGGAAGGGAYFGGEATGGKWWGELAGGLLGPATYAALSPTMVMKRILNTSKEAASETAAKAPGAAERYILNTITDAAAGSPEAVPNVNTALRVGAGLGEGWKPSIGEMTGTPALLDLESRFAMTSPATLNREAARRAGNTNVVLNEFATKAPEARMSPQELADAVNASISNERVGLGTVGADITSAAPKTSQADVGSVLLKGARAEKDSMRERVVNPAYEKAFDAAGNEKIDVSPLVSKVEEIFGSKLSEVKPSTNSETMRALRRIFKSPQDKSPEELAYLSAMLGGNIENASAGAAKLSLRELDDLRKAINMDIRSAKASMSPAGATQARNLMALHKEIDDAIGASNIPSSAKNLYDDAITTYREQFKPRFKEGVSGDLLRGSRTGEPSAIRLDEVVDRFFKPGGEVEAQQFARMAGANKEMASSMKSGILDKYRYEVIDPKTGQLDLNKHLAFMQKYEKPLDILANTGARDELAGIGAKLKVLDEKRTVFEATAKRIGFENGDDLVTKVLNDRKAAFNISGRLNAEGKQSLSRAVMDRAWEAGNRNGQLNPAGLHKFLEENRTGLLEALSATEGRQAALGHIESLQRLAKLSEIATRGKPVSSVMGAGDDPLRAQTGVSLSTVMSQARGIQMGRTSAPVAASMMAGPVMKKLGMEKFDKLMYEAMHDPEVARNLEGLIAARSEKSAMKFWEAIRSKIGPVLSGLKAAGGAALGVGNIPGNIARSTPATLNELATER